MNSELVERVARWIRRRDWRNGQMVDEYDAQAPYWRDEARKLLRVVMRTKK